MRRIVLFDLHGGFFGQYLTFIKSYNNQTKSNNDLNRNESDAIFKKK
jgi:hypothetical protein